MPSVFELSVTPPFLFIITFIFGLTIGSFLNVVIYRLPKMMERDWKLQCYEMLEQTAPALPRITLSTPNSTCPSCGHEIRPWENIPVLSYLFLKGKCSGCKNPISARYPIIELTSGILSVITIYHFGPTLAGLAGLFMVWTLITLTMIDFDTQLLPDSMTLPLLWSGLILNFYGTFTTLEAALWGAVAGYLSLWSVYWLFKLLTGKEGMGYGDFKLLAALGAWLGWQQLPAIILLSSLVGAVVGIALIIFQGRDKSIPIPFGPYLAAAGWLAMLWGQDITNAYLHYARIG
ncbi:MAG: prepilin peptidase [Hahellaceae bacterium]|nr:prepilin peptidase [Hahellaceae bacterium]MCP5169082.1 prepilin peptidase [Hahellaceae bacterium]